MYEQRKVVGWMMTDFPMNITTSHEVCAAWHRQKFNVSPLCVLTDKPPVAYTVSIPAPEYGESATAYYARIEHALRKEQSQ